MIRKVTAQEFDICAQLIRASFLTVADEFGITAENAPRFTAFAMSGEKLMRQYQEEHRPMYVYEKDKMPVGFYSLSGFEEDGCELNNLAVLPSCRHEGIGGRLLRHAFAQARALGCGVIRIGIVEENTLLRRWYEAHGFVHTGTEKFSFFPFTSGYMERQLGGED